MYRPFLENATDLYSEDTGSRSDLYLDTDTGSTSGLYLEDTSSRSDLYLLSREGYRFYI